MRSVGLRLLAAGSLLIACGITAIPAQAGYNLTLTQQGSDVVASGSGAIDLTGLRFAFNSTSWAGMEPSLADISTGPTFGSDTSFYNGFTGPTSFGGGGATFASSGSGDHVQMIAAYNQLYVPQGYVSGTPLSDTSTYSNQTFASLGVTPGTYEWMWGTGPNQNFTLHIEGPGAAGVPEPSSLALLAAAVAGFALARFRKLRPTPASQPRPYSTARSTRLHGRAWQPIRI
jgi:hypothetical protein